MKIPTVSRISVSTVFVPVAARKSSIDLISLPVVLMLYAMPVMPVAHGALYLRVGSQSTFCSAGMRFFWFGNFAVSSGCTHGGFTWLMSRLAIQSVSTIESRPVPLPFDRLGRIFVKYSLLSLMSSA